MDSDRFNLLRIANSRLSTDIQFDFYILTCGLTIESYDVTGNMNKRSIKYVERNNDEEDGAWETFDLDLSIDKCFNSIGVQKLNFNL